MEKYSNINDHSHDFEKVIFGLGDTGLSIARHLYSQGDSFCVYDAISDPPRLSTLRTEMPEISFYYGETPSCFSSSSKEVLVSPGVSPRDPLIIEAVKSGAVVRSDLDLFISETKVPIIGITGSNGKTTVTELVGQMAVKSGVKVAVGGNLGPPALDLLMGNPEIFILELSSFQLEHSGSPSLAIASILNLSPDHLDRHCTMDDYFLAKQRIFSKCETAVINRNDVKTHPIDSETYSVLDWGTDFPVNGGVGLCGSPSNLEICFGRTGVMRVNELSLRGNHNLANALAALSIGLAAGFSIEAMIAVLKSFSGLPHRCEYVFNKDGVNWINDSKATNTGATAAALEGLGGAQNIILIAGGLNKGDSFQSLLEPIKKYCKQLVLMGEAADQIFDAMSNEVTTRKVDSIEEAVVFSEECSSDGDLVLLSPACSSFDMFLNYVDRGERFKRAIFDILDVAP